MALRVHDPELPHVAAVVASDQRGQRLLRVIRFDISIAGGRPWRLKVVGHAAVWEPGTTLPTENQCDCTATPICPVAASRATIE
jgi:hypothetical protein